MYPISYDRAHRRTTVKTLLALAAFCILSSAIHAQVVDTTVCEILKNPQSFNGKTVRVKGTVSAGFDQFVIKGADCGQHVDSIWLSYPEGTKGKAGPAAILQLQPALNFAGSFTAVDRTSVQLEKNKDFKQFDSLLSTPAKVSGLCLGCVRNEVNATMVGRLDGTRVELRRDASGKIVGISGFGNLNAYSARLVLESVSEVVAQEYDYSKPAGPVAASGDSNVATEFAGHGPLSEQPKRAIGAFGKEGDDNGVNVGFGGLNEATKSAETKGGQSSPDGVLFNCLIDGSRLKGDDMSRAMTHLGEHIADLRNPEQGNEKPSLYLLEYRAWLTTALGAIGTGQKSLTLPGGYLVWSSSWPQASLNKNTNDALTAFLASQALLSK
jgi:hypothetical protein